jgi:nitrile hydratase
MDFVHPGINYHYRFREQGRRFRMNGIHDMGGMHGFGPIEREENEPVFHHAWERRVFAMGWAPVSIPGGFRYAIERMDPAHYLTSSYYEKWLYAQTRGLIETGVLTQEQLDDRAAYFRNNPDATPPQRNDPELVQRVLAELQAPQSPQRDLDLQPAFDIGDAVRARNMHPVGHTRLPRYARGMRGVVARYHGIHGIDDTMPPGSEAQPQPVYSVRFEARELWGDSAEPNCAIYLDMWESYLEPA